VGQDCSARVTPSGINDPRVDAALIASFHRAIGRPDPAWIAEIPRTPVEIVILDTASQRTASAKDAVRNHSHGLRMREIVEYIACHNEDMDCLGAIRSAVAMPRHDGQLDW